VSFAGTAYRVGNRYTGDVVGVGLAGDAVHITQDGSQLRTLRARHDKSKEFLGTLQARGKPRRTQNVA
jgi:hypothetical protein